LAGGVDDVVVRLEDATKFRGRKRLGWAFTFAAAYNLARLPKLMEASA
jgi:hypothetical protein